MESVCQSQVGGINWVFAMIDGAFEEFLSLSTTTCLLSGPFTLQSTKAGLANIDTTTNEVSNLFKTPF